MLPSDPSEAPAQKQALQTSFRNTIDQTGPTVTVTAYVTPRDWKRPLERGLNNSLIDTTTPTRGQAKHYSFWMSVVWYCPKPEPLDTSIAPTPLMG